MEVKVVADNGGIVREAQKHATRPIPQPNILNRDSSPRRHVDAERAASMPDEVAPAVQRDVVRIDLNRLEDVGSE